MIDEGVIKFNCEWKKTKPLEEHEIQDLNHWRAKLFALGLIGVYPDGIAFGNISIRSDQKNQFIISGTQTGSLPKLFPEHYTRVTDYSIKKNWLECEGPIKASSESLTHAMIYELDPAISAVIHVHHSQLWNELKFKVPTTAEKIPYGTPEMALEVKKLYNQTDSKNQKILVMAGHEEGIIAFGLNLKEAAEILLNYYGGKIWDKIK